MSLKIKDESGKVIGILKDDASEPEMEEKCCDKEKECCKNKKSDECECECDNEEGDSE